MHKIAAVYSYVVTNFDLVLIFHYNEQNLFEFPKLSYFEMSQCYIGDLFQSHDMHCSTKRFMGMVGRKQQNHAQDGFSEIN